MIDGFPRGLEQAIKLENLFQEIEFILNFECAEEILVERLLERGKTSGRADDNEETIRTRIKVFNDNTRPALDFYMRFGKVHSISSIGSIEDVYSQVLANLQKNLVFFYGPPCIRKTLLATNLCQLTGYYHLELKSFWNKSNWTEEEKVNKLMDFISNSAAENFLIDGFFETKKQAKIFVDTLQKPSFIFYFEALKDFVDEQLLEENFEKQRVYKEYMKNRKDLVDFFKKESCFVKFSVDIENPIEALYAKIVNDYLAPEVYMGIYDDNEPLFRWYVEALEREKGFIHLPLNKLVEQEAERNTDLGKQIAKHGSDVPFDLKIAVLRKIIFKQGKKNKFLITEFPKFFEDYCYFEEKCRKISFVISFHQENQAEGKRAEVFPPQIYYHALGKHMVIDRESLALFDYYTQKKNTYYIAIAPPFFERTVISKHIAEKFGLQFVEWEETLTKLKEKLGGDDGPLEEVTVPQILKHFQEVFKALQLKGSSLIFDGFPFNLSDIESFVQALGPPKAILSLELSKDSIIKAYRLNKGIEPDAEIPEEEQEEINKGQEKHQTLANSFEALSEATFGTNFYKINSNISMSTIKLSVENLFYKRVYLASHTFPIYGEGQFEEKYSQIFSEIAVKSQVCFIDVRALLRHEFEEKGELYQKLNSQYLMRWTEKPHDFPSNYTPDLILELIKNHLARLPVQSRELFIYNYPMGDYTNDRSMEECIFPRALDELAQIEKDLGQIRLIFAINEMFAERIFCMFNFILYIDTRRPKTLKNSSQK